MPNRVKKPRSEQKRSSGSSPATKASKAQTSKATTTATASTPTETQAPVSDIQIPANTTSVPMPVTVLKTSPIKINNSSVMAARQEAWYFMFLINNFFILLTLYDF